MALAPFSFSSVLVLGLAGTAFLLLWRTRGRATFPPGPPGRPILGNLLQMPSEHPWKVFADWAKEYGDVLHFSTLQSHTIILSSPRAVSALSTSSTYDGRPIFTMYGALAGWDAVMTLLQPGGELRAQRRLLHRVLGTRANVEETFGEVQEREMKTLLERLLADPAQFTDHLRLTIGTIILQISHGYQLKEHADPLVNLNNRVAIDFSEATTPGAYLVDVFPPLRYVPEWFPGAGFKRKAKEYWQTASDLIETPHRFVVEQMAAGTASRSFTSTLLEEAGENVSPEDEHSIKYAASQLYSAGVDTSVGVIHFFLLAMTLHPAVQKRAQAELDAVLGASARLPTLADRDALPYVDALLKEVFRWIPVTPLGMPHRACEDSVLDGYFIPKNTSVITNIWAILHDPEIYADPLVFDPDRFMPSDEKIGCKRPETDPRDFCFGFGRRICPGQLLGEASVFLACAMLLTVFDLSKATMRTEDGREVEVEPLVDCTTGILSHPKPFAYRITPRSKAAEALIRSAERN